jgi:hypothetical protein
MDLNKELEQFNNALRENYGLSVENLELNQIDEAEQQRTEQWMKDRLGMFSGSGAKNLMACKMRPSSKNPKDWGQKKWLCSLGDSALNYIIERAIERATGVNIEKYLSWHAKWGINHEDEAKAYISENEGISIKEKGFVKFLKNAGASPDGEVFFNEKDNAFEVKCPATVLSHLNLMNSAICEGHEYFWQTQFEMMALNVKDCLFYTYDKRFPESAKIGKQTVELSPIHAFAVEFRCIIGEKLINKIIEKNFKLDVYAELAEITESIPEELEDLQKWFEDERKAIQL